MISLVCDVRVLLAVLFKMFCIFLIIQMISMKNLAEEHTEMDCLFNDMPTQLFQRHNVYRTHTSSFYFDFTKYVRTYSERAYSEKN